MNIRKTVSILCTAPMLLSGITAYAENSDLSFLTKEYKSFEGKIKISAKLNKPLDVLSKVPIGNDYVDLQKLVESALKSTGEYSCKAIMNLDSKKMQLEMTGKSNLPLTVNKNLDVDINAKQGIWLDLDFGDSENPVYRMIMQNPIFDKYIYMDMTDEALLNPTGSVAVIGGADGPTSIYVTENDSDTDEIIPENPIATMARVLDKASYYELQKSAVNAMEQNSRVVKTGNNVTVTFTDKGVKQYFEDILKASFKQYGSNLESLSESSIGSTLKNLKNVPIFDENEALKLEYVLDSNDYVKSLKTTVNIKTNLFALAASGENSDTIELKSDKSDLDLTLYTETEYTKINGNVVVSMPELTDENSFNPLNIGDSVDIEEGSFDYSKCSCEYYDLYLGSVKIDGNNIEFPLRTAFSDANVEYNNGRITITKAEQQEDEFNLPKLDDFFENTMILNIGSNIAFADDKAITLSDAPHIINDITYISNKALEEITGLKLNYLDGIPDGGNLEFSANYEKECDYCKEFFADSE